MLLLCVKVASVSSHVDALASNLLYFDHWFRTSFPLLWLQCVMISFLV